VELIAGDLDPAFIPTYGLLATTYRVLGDFPEGALDDALGQLGVERVELVEVAKRYAAFPDLPSNAADLRVLTFLFGRCKGRSSLERARFEAAVAAEGEPSLASLFAPFGVPAVAGLRRRSLLFPILVPQRTAVLRAYQGLVEHLRLAEQEARAAELSCSAILWRVAAVIDGLVDAEVGLYEKMNILRNRVANSGSVSDMERQLWQPLTKQFANRRHALTHIAARERPTFEESIEYALTERAELVSASSALGLAVLHDIAADLAALPAPQDAWTQVWGLEGTGWIGDQL
jgi:hypothetical protein